MLVRLTPKASRAKIGDVVELPDGRIALQVHVNAPPEGGKANAAMLRLLAKTWRLPKTNLRVTAGTTSRLKTVRITGDSESLIAQLTAWLDKMPTARH